MSRRVLAAVLITVPFFGGLVFAACADATTSSGPSAEVIGEVRIRAHLSGVERWEASGPLVDDGTFCPSGRRHLVNIFDPDTGEEISVSDYDAMFDDLRGVVERPDVVLLYEHACDDGAGAFVAAENQERGGWELRSGTGRFSGATGTGSASFVVDLQARPSEVYVIAELGTDPRSGQ